MGNFIDLSGQRFGMLTVVERVPSNVCSGRNKGVLWICRCDCGNIKQIRAGDLKRSPFPSCGCALHQIHVKAGQQNKKHGKRNTRLYSIYQKMKQRCYNTHCPNYDLYGGRGIQVCEEWLRDFMNFYNWAIHNGYKYNLTLDRINNNGNYEPSNCRWATVMVQANNRRSTINITYKNKTQSIAMWAKEFGLPRERMWARLKSGWSMDKIEHTPIKKYNKKKIT